MSTDINKVQEFIRNMLSATTNATLYSMEHQQVSRMIDAAFSSIKLLLADMPEVSIVVAEGELVINGQLQELNLFQNRFVEIMKLRGISQLKFFHGLTKGEIETLVSSLSRQGDTKNISPSEHVQIGQVELRLGADSGCYNEDQSKTGRAKLSLSDIPKEELERFKEIYNAVQHKKRIKISGLLDIVSGFIDAFRQEGISMLVMASLRSSDEYTFTHSTNVCILNIAQAMSLGIEGQLLHDIGIAAMLHDIGKLFIPLDIILKKDKLTDKEFSIMKQHPVLGAKHLLDTPGVPRLAVTAAYEHHLKYNLSGYPTVPAGWQLNLCSQMTMISDFFDALRTRRSYREPMDPHAISGMMLDMMDTDFHPALTRNFLSILARLET